MVAEYVVSTCETMSSAVCEVVSWSSSNAGKLPGIGVSDATDLFRLLVSAPFLAAKLRALALAGSLRPSINESGSSSTGIIAAPALLMELLVRVEYSDTDAASSDSAFADTLGGILDEQRLDGLQMVEFG